jgi:hypothetical protein
VEAGICQVIAYIEAHGSSRFEAAWDKGEERVVNPVRFRRRDAQDPWTYMMLPQQWRTEDIQENHCGNRGGPGNPRNREGPVSRKGTAAPVWWRGLYGEKLAKYRAHPHAEAERLAYGELILQWHRWNGWRWPFWQCAGCGAPISGVAALDLADGNRVHFDERGCLIRFGRRWRGEAVAALRAIGLDLPAGFELL